MIAASRGAQFERRALQWARFAAPLLHAITVSQSAFGQQGQATSVVVSAEAEWVDTGVYLRRGARFDITAEGRWSNEGRPAYGPAGAGAFPGTVLEGANIGALIGRIGDQTFVVGERYRGQARADGELLPSINDVPGTFRDNQGYVRAAIRAEAAQDDPRRGGGDERSSPSGWEAFVDRYCKATRGLDSRAVLLERGNVNAWACNTAGLSERVPLDEVCARLFGPNYRPVLGSEREPSSWLCSAAPPPQRAANVYDLDVADVLAFDDHAPPPFEPDELVMAHFRLRVRAEPAGGQPSPQDVRVCAAQQRADERCHDIPQTVAGRTYDAWVRAHVQDVGETVRVTVVALAASGGRRTPLASASRDFEKPPSTPPMQAVNTYDLQVGPARTLDGRGPPFAADAPVLAAFTLRVEAEPVAGRTVPQDVRICPAPRRPDEACIDIPQAVAGRSYKDRIRAHAQSVGDKVRVTLIVLAASGDPSTPLDSDFQDFPQIPFADDSNAQNDAATSEGANSAAEASDDAEAEDTSDESSGAIPIWPFILAAMLAALFAVYRAYEKHWKPPPPHVDRLQPKAEQPPDEKRTLERLDVRLEDDGVRGETIRLREPASAGPVLNMVVHMGEDEITIHTNGSRTP